MALRKYCCCGSLPRRGGVLRRGLEKFCGGPGSGRPGPCPQNRPHIGAAAGARAKATQSRVLADRAGKAADRAEAVAKANPTPEAVAAAHRARATHQATVHGADQLDQRAAHLEQQANTLEQARVKQKHGGVIQRTAPPATLPPKPVAPPTAPAAAAAPAPPKPEAKPGDAAKPAPASGDKPVTYTRREDRAAAAQQATSTHGEWAKGLSKEQGKALDTYIGEDYKDVNKSLRDGKNPANHPGLVEHMDAAIAAAPPLPHDAVMYRGIGPGLAKQLQPGATFEDKAYVSTSINRHVAENFAEDAMIEMHVPKGTKAAAVDAMHPGQGDKSENEYILPRGSKFKVTGRRRGEGGNDIITMELVPHGK